MKLLPPEYINQDSRRVLKQLLTAGISQVNIYEAKRGSLLGNHYHKETLEYFLIIKGTVLVVTRHVGQTMPNSQVVNKDNLFVVETGEIHTIECLTNVTMLTFLTKAYNSDDPDTYK